MKFQALVVTTLLFLQGCVALPARNPLPEDYYPQARVLGLPDLRSWGDEEFPIGKDLPDNPTREQIQALVPGLFGQELNFLAISGGGENGAFAAGILNGWSASGTRPEFNIVRLATHTAPLQEPMLKACVNVVPRRARRSRLGVSM